MPRAVFALSFVALVACAASAQDRYVSYSGTATARGSAQVVYGEKHLLRYHDEHIAERIVLYTCPDGAAFARKTVAYVDSLAPDFLLEDASRGMREGVRSGASARTVFFRGGRDDMERSGTVPQAAGLVVDAGFDEFVRKYWDALMAGQTLRMPFLLPSRLNALAFQVKHVRADTIGDVPSELFRLNLAGVLGWVTPGIEVYYRAADHALLRFDGLSDLRDAAGENLDVQIDFAPADRMPSDSDALAAALKAPLSPCS